MQETLAASVPGGSRTHTPRRTPEPKSGASASSATDTLTYSIFARPTPKGQPVRPVGLEPTRREGHQNLILARLPFRHGHYTPSQSRRTTGNYGNTIARPPARAQADNTRPHRNIRHNKQRTITARNHTMLPVGRVGLEPATSRLVTGRSVH